MGTSGRAVARLVCVAAWLAVFTAGSALAQQGPLHEIRAELGAQHPPASMADVHARLPAYQGPRSVRELSLRPRADVAYTPSPPDWRDAEIYLVMPDRFERGPGAMPSGDPANGRTWHGGNIRGLIERLPYIRPIANTLWVTPVLRNNVDTYHGYGAVNLLDVDPRFGTMEDYKRLVQEAHRLGMRVVMDFVFNHAGNVFSYRDGEQRFSAGPKAIAGIHPELVPSELRGPEHFSRQGVASGGDWENPDAILNADFGDPDGAFEPLRDLATANRQTQNILLRTAMHWMRETDIDGMRLDTVKHAHPTLWPRVASTLTRYAQALRSPVAPEGKRNFLLLGEVYTGDRRQLASYLGPYGKGLSSVFDFASAFGNRPALQGKAPTTDLERNFQETKATFGERASFLTQFQENHDLPRFLREGDPQQQLGVATAHTLFSEGAPQLFYGSEQAMPQMDDGNPSTGDPGNRPDMFAGRYRPPSLLGRSSFDTSSPPYRLTRTMVAVRRAFEPLRRGEQWVRYANPTGPGGYVFSRIQGRREVVVAMNTSDRPLDLRNIWVDHHLSAPGTELVDALDDGYSTHVEGLAGGSQVSIQIPPRSVRVLASREHYEEEREEIALARTSDHGPTGVEPPGLDDLAAAGPDDASPLSEGSHPAVPGGAASTRRPTSVRTSAVARGPGASRAAPLRPGSPTSPTTVDARWRQGAQSAQRDLARAEQRRGYLALQSARQRVEPASGSRATQRPTVTGRIGFPQRR